MDTSNAVWEFFSPFAHIPGKYEWCRIHSPTHGSFDCFILLAETTARPPTVYVASDPGERFMRDRYPESAVVRVGNRDLSIRASEDLCDVRGALRSTEGPVRAARMRLRADRASIPTAVPYGGDDFPVWGGRWACSGVDLNRDGLCDGRIRFANGSIERFSAAPCIVAAGSFAAIVPFGIVMS